MNSNLTAPARCALLAVGCALVSFASPASSQDLRFRDGRFREAQGGVTIQRADEAGADEAVLNMPFLPGDRVWTDDSGRAEILFAEGEILWISERAKVDSLGRGGREQDERLGLRVFAGSFAARVRPGGPGFEFRAPGGNLSTTGPALFRLDVRGGETVVSVREGEILADFAGEKLTLRSGEFLSYFNDRVEGPFSVPPGSGDAFDDWVEQRNGETNRYFRSDDRLPDELDEYGYELDQNGDWVYDEPQGYVYVPRVARDWVPYTYGRWVYTLYGWTWVADEPWGFVTSHYGRWGYSSQLGWHWLPRSGFAGAWVAWSSPVGLWSNTIGWCALGFDNRPVGGFSYGGGRAVARDPRVNGSGWTFASRSDLGRAGRHRSRIDLPAEALQNAVVWGADHVPDRGFREAQRHAPTHGEGGSRAVRRGEGGSGLGSDGAARIYVKPSPGDSTPELRSDPMTTIPNPASRRQKTLGQDGFKDEQNNRRNRSHSEGSEASLEEAASNAGEASRPIAAPEAQENRQKATRDPLLSRFFRSITRPSSTGSLYPARPEREPDSARETPSAQRRDPGSRSPSASDPGRSPERAPSPGSARERARPGSGERAQPRATPAPRSTPKPSSADDRGVSRRPRKDQ